MPVAAANIVLDASIFRIGFVADIGMATAFVFVGILLYLLFRHVDRKAAGAMMVFVAVGAGMILVNLLFHHAALLVATDPSYVALGAEGSDAIVLLVPPGAGRPADDRGRQLDDRHAGRFLAPDLPASSTTSSLHPPSSSSG